MNIYLYSSATRKLIMIRNDVEEAKERDKGS